MSCLARNVGCVLPSGGLVSADLYAREVRGIWCQRSAQAAIAACLAFFFWFLTVCGSARSLRSAVRMASNASCLALLKPTEGLFLGSQSSRMFTCGWVLRSSPSRLRCSMEMLCFSCGEASNALFMANFEGINMSILRWSTVSYVSKRSVSMSNTGVRGQRAVPFIVTVSPNTRSECFHSQPFWYRTADAAPTCLPSSQFLFDRVPSPKMLIVWPSLQRFVKASVA